ncbi:putative white-brown complex homolog protein 30 [Carica papaya]|uniref:putative white-brown complex homolog protein 30 n=1 Tax=Carica papaya TaxID=3649 RepID=UPI000B8CA70F|nr:putative white-brown complex homolog protein 30 [Carica papaya]
MSRLKIIVHACRVPLFFLFFVVALSVLPFTLCVDGNDYSQTGNPAAIPLVTGLIYSRLSNLSTILADDIVKNLGYCIKDVKKDWDGAFDFTGKLDFLSNCIKKTKGDLTLRLCTAAEIKFYFNSFIKRDGVTISHVRPNKNCNLTNWVAGCEPGWGCSADQKQHVELKNAKDLPLRTRDCQPCCEGFFCPQGLTCMIPCPLGAYCPLAKLNKTTGICHPYNYQIPPGQPDHTCGTADSWADVESTSDIFCLPGSYCPTTIREVPCSSGHYCRTGSTSQSRCLKLSTCNAKSANQNIHAYGIILIAALSTLMIIIYNCSDQALSTRERKQAKSREAAARHARETAQARERWKAAKDVAKIRKVGLQEQITRTFSRKKSTMQSEPLKTSNQTKTGSEDTLLPPLAPGTSTLAGKATGCTSTGLILINGKNESIHSYKKIIGFVPQDDIVHGNLTVEENLRFSARCRLSADMPKADKVLVIERVIECLGLQAVRDSLVGTVERRGISGGQKKRVNVGLEMVMEPSLLILDEPTSGLDSASSQLLLRALRREALEGVNICMVLHQPSYTLYKMFDDLILLAKGGLTVYHGSVKKVEEYFAGLGITVPERVNPPDHYIDILEGIVKPSGGLSTQQLPVRWMLHNGYPVPHDMLQYCDGIATSSNRSNTNDATNPSTGAMGQSFGADLWADVKCNVELKRDHIKHNFVKSADLSNRRTPGFARQYRYFLGRVGKQRLREARVQVLDYLILLVAGACLGTLAKVSDETIGSLGYTYTVIAVSLLCKIGALRSFSLDKLHYWRESAAGISSSAYFLSKDTLDHFNTLVKPLFYMSMFYFFNNPRSSFIDNYLVLLCLVYCVTGVAYIFAIWLDPSPAQLWSVLLPVVLTLIAIQDKDNGITNFLGNFCYTKWALEAFIIANAQRYSGVWLITRCSSLMQSGYDLDDWHLCLFVLVLFGIISRFVAFFCMVTLQKK